VGGNPGEERAWELLAACDPDDVCARTLADYLPGEEVYCLQVFGLPVEVDVEARTIKGSDPRSEFILTKAAYFSRLSILHYLAGGQCVAPSGRLLRPVELKSGQFFTKGSHVLPLDAVATRFSGDPTGFTHHAARFGGEPLPYGDASAELRPFPRLPVTLILWDVDEEFPARCDLLFDDTCELHLPADVIWSTAMMCAKVMLQG
jgi:hypothetical protein